MGLEVLCTRAAQERDVAVGIGAQGGAFDALIRDAVVVCTGAQDAAVAKTIEGLVPQTPGNQEGIGQGKCAEGL